MKRRTLLVLIAMGAIASVLTGCSKEPASTERVLTQQEASTLAQTLYLNLEKGGASFEVNTIVAPGRESLRMAGLIDWKNHIGHARVAAAVANSTLTEVVWISHAIAERRPAFDAQLAKSGAASPIFLLRQPNMERRLDQVIAVIMGLATEQPENSQLILQKPGSAFLRDDVLDGKQVSVMRYGSRNVYWIEKDTGLLLRIEGSNQAGTQPILVDLRHHGEQKIGFPAKKYLLDAETHADYMALMSNF